MQFTYATTSLKIEHLQNLNSVWGSHPLTNSPQTHLVGTASHLGVV